MSGQGYYPDGSSSITTTRSGTGGDAIQHVQHPQHHQQQHHHMPLDQNQNYNMHQQQYSNPYTTAGQSLNAMPATMNRSPLHSFHSRQLSADSSGMNSPIPQSKVSEELYTATYSGIPVFEIMVNGVAVMRRRHDSCLNATQILKVAGVEKSKRTKVLEKEILTGEHEKVQGGYGKYQGTWIPFERGVALCQQYNVYDSLMPLLQFDPTNQMEHTPTKEQALAAKRKRTLTASRGPSNISGPNSISNGMTFSHPLQVTGTGSMQNTPLSSNASAHLSTLGRPMLTRQDTIIDNEINQYNHYHDNNNSGGNSQPPPVKRQRINEYEPPPIDDDSFPDVSVPLEPVDPSFVDVNLAHSITRLFVGHDQGDPVQTLAAMPEINRDTIDIPIDDSGHTALHWASALAMAPLVKELVRHGANQQRGNYAGETTLVRAVLVTNSFDVAIFPQLLESLYPAIPLIDKHGRSVLHHIALTAGIKGRSGASKYYLESLLEWVVKRGSKGKTKRYGLDRFMREVVNAQDKNGDTALNIAARVGNKSIAQQLLDVGANPHIANRANLKPTDFGIVLEGNSLSEYQPQHHAVVANANNSSSSTATNAVNATAAEAAEKRRATLEAMTKIIQDLDSEFKDEMDAKQQQIDSMHGQLRQTTSTLTQRRERFEELKDMNNKLVEHDRSIHNLDRAIEEEDMQFQQQEGHNHMISGFDGDFDADQPFRIDDDHNAPPAILLNARISAYKRNQAKLEQLGQDLKSRSSALEQKFKKVVSLCTGVDEDRVDSLLEGLVQAVASDREDVDIDRVAGFLRKIDRSHQGGVVV